MKSKDVTHHRGYDGTVFYTVEDEIEGARGRLSTLETSATRLETGYGPLAGFRNCIINGSMSVAQRGTAFDSTTTPVNSDDTYLLDRWLLLSDGNDAVDVSRSTTAPTGGLYSMALDVETANKKFGILQVIEQKDCIGLIGNTVTLSFKAKVSSVTNLDNLKAAIIAWSSTADTVTSDIISAWDVEGTNPTLAANWTYENTPANLSPTASFATYSVSAAVDTASTTNIGVFIWSDVTTTSTGSADILYITDVQLEYGSTASLFERRPSGLELLMAQRYYWETDATNGMPDFYGYNSAAAAQFFTFGHPVEMRISPVATKAGTWAVSNCGQPATPTVNKQSWKTSVTVTALAAFQALPNGADDKFTFDAEL